VIAARVLLRNTCSRSKIDQRYTPLIGAAIAAYQALFEADLVDVRLLGSVARGEAISCESDIDFLALVRPARATWRPMLSFRSPARR
jgi:predicted nucleotidyltransferase